MGFVDLLLTLGPEWWIRFCQWVAVVPPLLPWVLEILKLVTAVLTLVNTLLRWKPDGTRGSGGPPGASGSGGGHAGPGVAPTDSGGGSRPASPGAGAHPEAPAPSEAEVASTAEQTHDRTEKENPRRKKRQGKARK